MEFKGGQTVEDRKRAAKAKKEIHKKWLLLMDSKRCCRRAERKVRALKRQCQKNKEKLLLVNKLALKLRQRNTAMESKLDLWKRSCRATESKSSQEAKDLNKKFHEREELLYSSTKQLADTYERGRELEEYREILYSRLINAEYIWHPLYNKYKYLKANFKNVHNRCN